MKDVAVLTTVTLAPPTAAPVASFTVPTNVAPPPVWAIPAPVATIRVTIPRSAVSIAGRHLDAKRKNRTISCGVINSPLFPCFNDLQSGSIYQATLESYPPRLLSSLVRNVPILTSVEMAPVGDSKIPIPSYEKNGVPG